MVTPLTILDEQRWNGGRIIRIKDALDKTIYHQVHYEDVDQLLAIIDDLQRMTPYANVPRNTTIPCTKSSNLQTPYEVADHRV